MKMRKICLSLILICATLMSCGQKAAADANAADSVSTNDVDKALSMFYLGTYKEVCEPGIDAQMEMFASDDQLFIKLMCLYEVRLEAVGKIDASKASATEKGVSLPMTLRQYEDDREVLTDDVTIIFEREENNLYTLHVVFDNEPSESAIRNLMMPCTMFLTDLDENHIVQKVPFKVDKEKPVLADMLVELSRYVLAPELFETVKYINSGCDDDELEDTEQVRIDERDRHFLYSLGILNQMMEARCMTMKDGRLLLVTDRHDATYEYEQYLNFYVIDPKEQTITEEIRQHLLPEEWLERGDAVFQVRRGFNGLMVLFNKGEGLDIKPLKFDGTRFK